MRRIESAGWTTYELGGSPNKVRHYKVKVKVQKLTNINRKHYRCIVHCYVSLSKTITIFFRLRVVLVCREPLTETPLVLRCIGLEILTK